MLTNITSCPDIPALLKCIFKSAIDQAFEKARSYGLNPTKFGISIDSDGLGRGSVGACVRSPQMNTPEAIFNLFYETCQSGQNKLEEILNSFIDIHIQVFHGYEGGGLKRKFKNPINENSLIKVSFPYFKVATFF